MNDVAQSRYQSRQVLCLTWLAAVVPLGLAWRLAPLHLPPFAFKYGGSVLWAMAVYGAVSLLLPRVGITRVALTALVVAAAVELLKLLYWAPLDAFRETLAGKLLLGRYFSYGALIAYWLAILCTWSLDRWLQSRVKPAPIA